MSDTINQSRDLISSKSAQLQWRSSKLFTLFVVDFAIFTDSFLYGLIVPLAPSALHGRAGLSKDESQQWTAILLALYGSALVILSPTIGYFSDKLQARRSLFLSGLAFLATATALLCIGSHIALWIVGRILQGASGAIVWTAGMSLLVHTFEADELGRVMGSTSMAMVIGCMVGPILGGVLYQYGSYYAPYAFSFGLITLDFGFRLIIADEKRALGDAAIEGVPVARVGNTKLGQSREEEEDGKPTEEIKHVHSLQQRYDTCATSTAEETYMSSDITLLPAKRGRMVTLLRDPKMIGLLWLYLVTSLIVTAFDSFLPVFVQDTFGWEQAAQGLIFVTLIIPNLFDSVSGYVIDKWPQSKRYVTACGLVTSVPLFVCLRFVDHNTIQDKVLLCALLALIALCVGITQSPIMVQVSCLVRDIEVRRPGVFGKGGADAMAYGLLNSSFALGSVIAPFLGGFLRAKAGWATMCWVLALPAGASGLLALFLFGE
ncbi:hypothetical protein N7466_002080 [Penicillium verhagenii]|uniref:uncharacterized protein n=1 Tax=Penicillium verhagenii TaxID=1562060 RepID=UPI0025451F41|nr:uncharacterized protein N7466_002080 [Penicillium verhagenii]KAJ5938946.1 hypothetical protein N7466_002080 [Penicillium verhagenii]